MAVPPETSLSIKPVSTPWLWTVRIAAGVSTLPLFVDIFQISVPAFRSPSGYHPGVLLTVLVPLMAPYLYILFLLRGGPDKNGLALAVAAGSLWFVTAPVYLADLRGGLGQIADGLIIGLLVLAQPALVASALKTYYAMKRGAGDRTLLKGFGVFAIFAGLAVLMGTNLPGLGSKPIAANQASAVGSLRTIDTAEITYAETYKSGFSPTLAALGAPPGNAEPTASAAGLIDDVLAGGRKSGYTFTYTPGPKDPAGLIKTYTVITRPVKYGEAAGKSFFTDESGVIRQTSDDRPATAKDPPIGG